MVQNDVKELKTETERIQKELKNVEGQMVKANVYSEQKLYDEAIAVYQELSSNQETHKTIQSLIQQVSVEKTKRNKRNNFT